MTTYQITYEELPEFLFKESKSYDTIRREITTIVNTCKKHGFDSYSATDEYRLSDFIENAFSIIKFEESKEGVDLSDLNSLIYKMSGIDCQTVQDTIEQTIKLLTILETIKHGWLNNPVADGQKIE